MSDSACDSCAVCQSTDGLQLCPSCNSTSYCCKDHQVQHWKNHKPHCIKPEDIAQSMSTLEVSGKTTARPGHTVDRIGEDSPTNHVADAQAMDRTLPRDLPAHINRTWIMQKASNIVNCLNKFGIAVTNDFLGLDMGNKILKEAMLLHDRQMMTDGQTVVPSPEDLESGQKPKKYRLDKISWVDGVEDFCPNIGLHMTVMDTVMQQVREKLTGYNIKGRTKVMVACYPGKGSHYMRHVDNPLQDGRLLTCIYYLNKDWDCRRDGGMLKIYPQGSTRVASIEPLMDRLIVFWSDSRNPHEVLPAFKTRFAVTTWYFDADERTKAMKRQSKEQKGV